MVIACVLAPMLSLAQQDQGVITGRVTDASGAVLPGVAITATRVATGVASQAVTTAKGLYTIPALPIGTYRVVAEVPGFKRTVRESIDVHALHLRRCLLRVTLSGSQSAAQVAGTEHGGVTPCSESEHTRWSYCNVTST